MPVVGALLKRTEGYGWVSAGAVLGTIGEVAMEVALPFIMSKIIDDGIQAGDMGAILRYGGLMVLMAFLSLAFGVFAGWCANRAATGFACNIREAVFDKVQAFSFANIDKFSTAGLVTRMTTDVTNVQMAYQMVLRVASRAPIMLVSSLVMCLVINVELSQVFLVTIAILAVALALIIVNATKRFNVVFDAYDDLNASVQENVGAIRVVKAFVREDYENSKFAAAVADLYRRFVAAEGLTALNAPVMMLAIYGSIIGISWLGAHLIVGGTLTTGELTSMFSYVMQLMMSLMMLSMIVVMITMSMASMRRITECLSEVPDIADPANPVYEVADGSIDFDHVTFRYAAKAEHRALAAIDLHVASGETIGVIGGTGSGKTTLVSLVPRLYDASEGVVRVGGRDVREYDLQALRDAVAVVLQKNVLFSGTILENLRWGDEDATLEECRAACRAAAADDFVMEMPEGYDTRIERGGTNVSGGQKQRLCIARALLKHPKVLILDDSTSAVDTATDARIREALATYMPDTTKVIIAQRVSSVQHADRIVVLDGGHLNAVGTHEELLESNEIYRDIYESQVQGGGDFDQPVAGEAATGREA